MTISLNWLKDYLDIDLSPEEISTLLTDIGLEVEGYETVETVKGGLRGLVVGEVIECAKHPDADKLSLTKVDAGTGELLQIVCGAPNVAAGQKVIVALVGSRLFPLNGEAFEIKKAKIRGVESSGMLCAEDEIGLGASHDGILVLPAETPVGKPVAEVFGIRSDIIFEIGLTPNRTDAFSHIGVARDLAAALSFRNDRPYALRLPEVNTAIAGDPFPVVVENVEACPHYAGLVIEGVQVAESPQWLQDRLKAIGQKPINNIVDITNYVLHEYGQPLHAFDKAEIKGGQILVKNLPAGTKFLALDNSTIELHADDLIICDGESNGMCIAGVYGGLNSGVKASTTAIFLESAYFDPATIRRTSTRHGLRTEAATHFEKGIDPHIAVTALKRAASLIVEIAGGKIASGLTDLEHKQFEPFRVTLKLTHVKRLVGIDIPPAAIEKILGLLEIGITEKQGDTWQLAVPPYRTDVQREADVIEDILRIYGFNNVPIPNRLNATINFTEAFDTDKAWNRTADQLVSLGFYEIMTNPLTKSRYLEKLQQHKQEHWVNLLSSINVELDVMRNNMLFSGLESVAYNLNHKNGTVRFFEMGKTYHKFDTFTEVEHLSLFVSGNKAEAGWSQPQRKADLYYLKAIVEGILRANGVGKWTIATDEPGELFEYSLKLVNGKQVLAELGQVNTAFTRLFDIKPEVFFADVQWENVLTLARQSKIQYREVSKFPAVRRDLALLLDKKVMFSEVQAIARKVGKPLLREVDLFDIYEDEKIGPTNKSYAVSFIFKEESRTLQDAEIDRVMQQLIASYRKELNATIR